MTQGFWSTFLCEWDISKSKVWEGGIVVSQPHTSSEVDLRASLDWINRQKYNFFSFETLIIGDGVQRNGKFNYYSYTIDLALAVDTLGPNKQQIVLTVKQ